MKNNYFSKKDEMRPFVVKKINTPPPSMIETNNENDSLLHEKDKPNVQTNHRITDEHVYEVSGRRDKRFISSIKPFILSALSAIAIGVLLGFIVLRMSTSAAEPESEHSPSSSQVDVTADEGNEGEAAPINEYLEIGAIDAYVLQAGVYSEKENAEEMAKELEGYGHSQIVWEENEQFFVFTNVFSTEEQAKENVGYMEDIEVYAKQWRVEGQSVEITEEERAFLEQFVSTWEQTVEEHTSNAVVSLAEWEKLVEGMPSSNGTVQDFISYLDQEIVQADAAVDIEQLLLDTWVLYSKLEHR